MTDGYTCIPNYVLDNMHQMKGSVFQIVCAVARKTVGWEDGNGGRKEWDRISISQFCKATGLSNRSVIDAVNSAIADGWIERKEAGQYFTYRLEPVKKVHRSETQTSEKSSQVNTPTYEKSSQEPVKKVHTQKKDLNKEKESSANAAPPAPIDGKEPTEQQRMFEAICHCVGWDYKVIDKAQKGQIAQTRSILQRGGYAIDDLRNFYQWWFHKHWIGKDKGEYPTLKQLRAEIGKMKANGKVPEVLQGATNSSRRRMQEL